MCVCVYAFLGLSVFVLHLSVFYMYPTVGSMGGGGTVGPAYSANDRLEQYLKEAGWLAGTQSRY